MAGYSGTLAPFIFCRKHKTLNRIWSGSLVGGRASYATGHRFESGYKTEGVQLYSVHSYVKRKNRLKKLDRKLYRYIDEEKKIIYLFNLKNNLIINH